MAALDFPTSPSDGDIYNNYVYDATRGVWNVYAQGLIARYTVSDTKPTTATNGDAWFDTNEGITYVYYDDGDTAQWVETGNPVLSYNTVVNLSDTTISSPVDGQALTYDSSTGKWINETPASTLSDLTDTTLTTPSNGQILQYDGSAWIDGININPSSPAVGQALVYNGSEWVNGDPGGLEDNFLLMGA